MKFSKWTKRRLWLQLTKCERLVLDHVRFAAIATTARDLGAHTTARDAARVSRSILKALDDELKGTTKH